MISSFNELFAVSSYLMACKQNRSKYKSYWVPAGNYHPITIDVSKDG